MPPTPGKIHTLPVRVSYTVDNSDQAYFTVLSERQKVFIHPKPSSRAPARAPARSSTNGQSGANGMEDDQPGLGSCVLKNVIWGVCYASPECVPAPTAHDFSVYALDPSPPPSTAVPSPFPLSPTLTLPHPNQDRWDGKGFLSWALSEPGEGSTLIRGRLIHSPHAFESVSWNPNGGLEGLLAAEEQQADEEAEGGGWGLEVELNLKRIELGGRAVGDKKEFGEMIARTKEGEPAGMPVPCAVPKAPAPVVHAASGAHGANGANGAAGPRRRIEPRLVAPESGGKGPTFGSQGGPLVRSLAGPARASLSQAGSLPGPGEGSVRPQAQRASITAANISTPPPSSVVMVDTSSNQSDPAPTAPPLPRSSSGDANLPPSPGPNQRTSSGPLPRSSSSTTPTRKDHEFTPPHPPTGPSSYSLRETTPPPGPTRRSPPPSTPARLQAILRSDAKLSPGLARSLANNPTLLRLLKSVPASAIPLSGLSTLKSPFGGAGGASAGSGVDPNNPFGPPPPPPAFLKSSPAAAGTVGKPSPAESSTSASAASKLNTPESTATVTAGPGKSAKGKGKAASTATPAGGAERRCYNCGTGKSSQWRSKKVKGSGETLSVCDECGLYFNQHKKMRPVNGAGVGDNGEVGVVKLEGEGKSNTPIATAPISAASTAAAEAVSASESVSAPIAGPSSTKRKFEDPVQGTRSSPRRASGRQASHNDDNPLQTLSTLASGPPESPARKKKKVVPPSPSPRRNTRAAAKELGELSGGTSSVAVTVSTTTNASVMPFSPSSFFHTSPFDRPSEQSGGMAAPVTVDAEVDVDIEAFLAQFGDSGEARGEENGENVDLDKWFKDAGIDVGVIDGAE